MSKNTFFQRTRLVAASEISIAKFYVVSKTSFSVRTFMHRNLKTFSVRHFINLVFPPVLVKSSKVISCKNGVDKKFKQTSYKNFKNTTSVNDT